MSTLPLRRRGLVLGLSSLTLAASHPLKSQTLTGELSAYNHTDYASVASHFRLSNAQFNGTYLYNGDVVIFCSDVAADSIDQDINNYPFTLTQSNSPLSMASIEEFDVWSRYSNPQNESVAMAQAHWLIDNYYESYFVSTPPGETHARQYAFQNAIWEIMGDGGTSEGLNFANGNVNRSKFEPGGSSSAPELWNHMNILIDAVTAANVDGSYEARYQIFAALDSRDGYQDYLALATTTEAMIPEPSTSMLLIGTGCLLVGRRRRS